MTSARVLRAFPPGARLLLCLLLSLPAVSFAQEGKRIPGGLMGPASFAPAEASPPSQSAMTVEEATRIARRATGGRVLAAEQAFRRGTPGIKVRLLVDGARVVTVFVDDEGRIRGR